MKWSFNFRDQPESEPEPEPENKIIPPEGWYTARLVAVQHKRRPNPPYIVWIFELEDIPNATQLHYVTTFKESTLWRTKHLLYALTGLLIEGVVTVDTDKLLGMHVNLKIRNIRFGRAPYASIVEIKP